MSSVRVTVRAALHICEVRARARDNGHFLQVTIASQKTAQPSGFLFEKRIILRYNMRMTTWKRLTKTNLAHRPVLLLIYSVLLSLLTILVWHVYPLAIALAGLVGTVLLFAWFPFFGFSLLLFFGLFHGWVIDFSQIDQFREIRLLSQINAPVVDFLAILLGVGLPISWASGKLDLPTHKKHRSLSVGFILYGLFVLSGLISAMNAYDGLIGSSIKFLIRPMTFVFVAYWIFPQLYLRKRKELMFVLRLWFWTGISIAVYGLSSLFLVDQGLWFRVVPFAIKGFAPLGFNHNQLAEVLVSLFPIGLFLSFFFGWHKRNIYHVGTAVMLLALLLTLSRAAWLAVFVQLLALLFVLEIDVRKLAKKYAASLAGLVLIAILAAGYMTVFLGSSVVSSSNLARSATAKMSAFYLSERPLLGHGPGMFEPVFADNAIYVLDFGDVLDAHGVYLKLAVETGWFGIILFTAFIGWCLHMLWKNRSSAVSRWLLLSVLGVLIFQLFNTSYYNSVMWLPLGVAIAAARLESQRFYE